jgi:hypothetical protein
MTKANYLSQPTIQRIPVLLQEIRDRVVVIPRFQRPFVWTDQQRLELMESIYSGIPIGSLLMWRTYDQGLQTYDLHGTDSQKSRDGNQRQYLLDGHQRVLTLFLALGPGLRGDDSLDSQRVTDDDDRLIPPIYFDLEAEEFVIKTGRGQPEPSWLPMSRLFDDFYFYEFIKRLARRKDGRVLIRRARSLHKTFYDYTIAVVPIITDDLDTAIKSFERVNRAGTPLTEIHMVSALVDSKGFDLQHRVQEIREELVDVGWRDLEAQMILNTCKVQLGLEIYPKDIEPLVNNLGKDPSVLDRAKEALVLAAEFLARACEIYSPQTLPYSYQIVLLADVLWRHSGPPKALDERLTKWLWVTTYSEYFSSTNPSRLRAAVEHIRALGAGNARPIPPDLSEEVLAPWHFDFRAARSRAMALRMARLEPVSPTETGYNAYELLASHGRQAMPKLLSTHEIDPEASEGFENRFIAAPKDITVLRRALRRPRELSPQSLLSHGITEQAANALYSGRYDEFLSLRRAFLVEWESVFVSELGLTYVDDE